MCIKKATNATEKDGSDYSGTTSCPSKTSTIGKKFQKEMFCLLRGNGIGRHRCFALAGTNAEALQNNLNHGHDA